MWLKSLNFLEGISLFQPLSRDGVQHGSRRERHIHGTYVVISDWERERGEKVPD